MINEMEELRKALSVTSRRKILEELTKCGGATAYELAEKVGISDSAIGKHLQILCNAGLVEGPTTDISTGRLKKIYKSSPNAEAVLSDFWVEEISSIPNKVKKRMYEKLAKSERAQGAR